MPLSFHTFQGDAYRLQVYPIVAPPYSTPRSPLHLSYCLRRSRPCIRRRRGHRCCNHHHPRHLAEHHHRPCRFLLSRHRIHRQLRHLLAASALALAASPLALAVPASPLGAVAAELRGDRFGKSSKSRVATSNDRDVALEQRAHDHTPIVRGWPRRASGRHVALAVQCLVDLCDRDLSAAQLADARHRGRILPAAPRR